MLIRACPPQAWAEAVDMGQLKLYLGPAGPYYYFEQYILSKFKDETDKYIYIVPVNRAVRYLKKRLILASTNKALIDPPVFTFTSLIRHFYRIQGGKKKVVSNSIRLILLKEALKSCQDQLLFFKDQRLDDKGWIRKIDQMLLEFSQYGYHAADFISPPPSSSAQYFDFSKILISMDQLVQNQLLDDASLFLEIIRDLDEQHFRKVFAVTGTILINGYGIYTPPMIEFIKKTRQWCDLQIKLDYNPSNRQLFQHTYAAYDSLQKIADEVIPINDDHDKITRYLFTTGFYFDDKIVPENRITVRKARNRREEIYYMAATIKDYHQKYQIPLDKIAITFPQVETYFTLLATIFKEYGIPYNISTGFPLAQSPLIKSYLQVIKTVLDNFRKEDIHQLIISPFLKQKSRVDPIILSHLSGHLRIRYFDADWRKSVDKVIKNGSEYGEDKRDSVFVEKVKTAVNGLQWLLDILDELKHNVTAQDFHQTYPGVLKKLGMLEWYREENDYLTDREKEKEFRAFNKFNKIFDQLCWILTFLYNDRKFSLNEFYSYLVLIIENTSYNLREWSNYGVQIMPRLEIQSVESHLLFIGGLVDGEFPRKRMQNIFFNDEECKMMGISSSEDIQGQDRFLFYQLISGSADEIILTYPAAEGENILLPSVFISVLNDICDLQFQLIRDQDLYLSEYQLKEKLASTLKSDITDKDLLLFKEVMLLTGLEEFKIWLDNIAILHHKKSRLKISSHEGDLSLSPCIKKMLASKFKDKYFSITELESYAFCPMQYFLKYILDLPEEREVEDRITPLEKGLLLHKILFRFYSELKQKGLQRRPWENLDLMIFIAQKEFDRLPYQGLWWRLEKEEYFGYGKNKGLFQTFLALERRELEESGFIPAHFEVAFGIKQSEDKYDKISSAKPFIIKREEEIKCTGKIDRIDLDAAGNLAVYDYKIGRAAEQIKMKQIFTGTSLQLPVYLAVVKDLLGSCYEKINPVGGAYYQIKDSEHCARFPVIVDGEKIKTTGKKSDAKLPNSKFTIDGKELSFWDMIDRSLDFVVKYTQEIIAGKFQHTRYPEDERCSHYCDFAIICRKDVGKLKVLTKDNH